MFSVCFLGEVFSLGWRCHQVEPPIGNAEFGVGCVTRPSLCLVVAFILSCVNAVVGVDDVGVIVVDGVGVIVTDTTVVLAVVVAAIL